MRRSMSPYQQIFFFCVASRSHCQTSLRVHPSTISTDDVFFRPSFPVSLHDPSSRHPGRGWWVICPHLNNRETTPTGVMGDAYVVAWWLYDYRLKFKHLTYRPPRRLSVILMLSHEKECFSEIPRFFFCQLLLAYLNVKADTHFRWFMRLAPFTGQPHNECRDRQIAWHMCLSFRWHSWRVPRNATDSFEFGWQHGHTAWPL